MLTNLFAKLEREPQRAAILYILISTLGFSAMSTGVRLISPELAAPQIVTLRNLLTLVLLIPWLARGGLPLIRTARFYDHAWRGAVGAVGMITWTYCLTIMPLAHATALSFTAPLLSTICAIIYLREKADLARWVALFAGFIGVLLILRPARDGFDWHALLVIFSTTSWAITGLFVKSLSRTEPPMRMVFYMNLFMFLIALPFGLHDWRAPSLHGWLILTIIACCSILMHFTMAKAYALAPVVTLMPLDFMRLVFTSLFAYLVFGEVSDAATWIGAAIIIASAIAITRRDVKSAPLM